MSLFEKISGRVYVIAEMSANHAGSLQNALRLVGEAKGAGADCLKIQTYTADTLTIDCDNEYFRVKDGLWDGYTLYDLYSEAATPWEWQGEIRDECRRQGIDFLSTPFDRSAVDFLERLDVEAYKIASFEIVDTGLIEYAAAKGKPMVLSCGMASEQEIADAVSACQRQGNERIVLLKCCSEYPAGYADMRLATIPDMARRFGLPVGLSDHSMGSLAAVVGVALGARVVEKHFCLGRDIPNPDSAFSMEPAEFAAMVRDIRAAEQIIGEPGYAATAGEQGSLAFRRSLFAVEDIKCGEAFTAGNVRSIRPGYGIKPEHLPRLFTERAARDIRRGEPIAEDMIEAGRDG